MAGELVVVDQWGRTIQSRQVASQDGLNGRPFGPSTPMRPYAGYSVTPREQDYVTGYNIAARPRRDERVDFGTLKGLIEAYDIAQICIWHRINSVRSLAWSLIAKPGAGGPLINDQIETGRRILTRPDRVTPFAAWLATYLYDVLAYDAGCLYRIRNNAGQVIGLKTVDGTTIAPLLDYYGGTPEAPEFAFVQFAQGIVWDWLTTDDLVYVPYQPTSGTPYGKAPIESVLLNANTDLRLQAYFMQRFTSGTVPEAFAGAPEGWNPDQIEEFQQQWDALLYGDDQAKHQVKWVPHGTTFAWSNEKDFDPKFSEFMAVKTAAAYHVVPSDIGILADVNKATSETQSDVQFRIGDLPLIQHVEAILTAFLQNDLGLDLEFEFDTGQEKEDRLNTAQADKIYIEAGVISISEARERVFGLSEPDGEMVARFVNNNKIGPIPLSQIAQLAGPTDPQTGSPDPVAGPPAPAPVVGSEVPVGPASDGVAAAVAGVAKAETVGIVEATGAHGSPLLAAGDDEDDEELLGVVKGELATFRRFVETRAGRGRWRDFRFDALDPRLSRRLNQAGRGQVRKATGQMVAAGLAVVAAGTGRVLMLQRALDPADPAGGTWEFPGGCIEDGETPLQAAWREWQEETGCSLAPYLELATAHAFENGATWTSSNGLYQGFVIVVPDETILPVNAGTARVLNPDDPDGDCCEVAAWWDPSLLEDNPAVRSELAQDLPIVLEALAGTAQVAKGGDASPKASWRDSVPKAPQHAYDLRLTDYWAPRIAEALHSAFPAATRMAMITAAAAAVPGVVVKTAAPADVHGVAIAATAGVTANTTTLDHVLRMMLADAYTAGLHTAAGQAGGYVTSDLGQVAAGIDWATWAPGDADAALAAADGGLSDLLDGAGATVKGMSDTTLERLGNLIADGLAAGDSIDDIAGSLGELLDDPSRAEMIAHTESARAVDVATMDTYSANGIAQYEVLLADGACDECEGVADGNPYPVDDGGQVPVHPRCRCASAPVYVDSGGDEQTGPETDSGDDG